MLSSFGGDDRMQLVRAVPAPHDVPDHRAFVAGEQGEVVPGGHQSCAICRAAELRHDIEVTEVAGVLLE